MALVVDAARPAPTVHNVANETYQKGNDAAGTPNPTWDIGFTVEQAVADTHVTSFYTDGTITPPTPTDQAGFPLIDMSSFFLATTAGTVRV